jgi:hypothetical protein
MMAIIMIYNEIIGLVTLRALFVWSMAPSATHTLKIPRNPQLVENLM